MKRIVKSIFCAAIIPALFWIAGFDFDERGGLALLCAIATFVVFFSANICLLDDSELAEQ